MAKEVQRGYGKKCGEFAGLTWKSSVLAVVCRLGNFCKMHAAKREL